MDPKERLRPLLCFAFSLRGNEKSSGLRIVILIELLNIGTYLGMSYSEEKNLCMKL